MRILILLACSMALFVVLSILSVLVLPSLPPLAQMAIEVGLWFIVQSAFFWASGRHLRRRSSLRRADLRPAKRGRTS